MGILYLALKASLPLGVLTRLVNLPILMTKQKKNSKLSKGLGHLQFWKWGSSDGFSEGKVKIAEIGESDSLSLYVGVKKER